MREHRVNLYRIEEFPWSTCPVRPVISALVVVAIAACDAPSQESTLIYSSPTSAVRYEITADSIVMADSRGLVELERDGTFRGTITDQPFTQMDAGFGWIAWSDVRAVGGSQFKPHFFRRSASGIEEAMWPHESGNVDRVLATPDGIVIDDSYQQALYFWGASSIAPLDLGETDVVPWVFDDGWLYAAVNASSQPGRLMRFRLDGSRKEVIASYGGPEGVAMFGVSGSRLIFSRSGYPLTPLFELDLATRAQRELGDLPYYTYSPIAVSAEHAFVDAYRVDDGFERFLPASSTAFRIVRLDLIDDDLYWSTETSSPDETSTTFAIYRADASGEPLATPTTDNDTRPPWL